MRGWALTALIAPAVVACGLDRAGISDNAALDASGSATMTTGASGPTHGTGAGGGPPTSGAGGTGGATSGAGGGTLACWGPDTICCAGMPCPIATMECCLTHQDLAEEASCVAKDACQTLTVTCDDSEDCPSDEVCCIDWDGFNYHSVDCEDSCDPPDYAGQPGEYPMCNLDGGTCPDDLVCNMDVHVGDVGWGYCFEH